MQEKIKQFAEMLKESNNIVFFGGAGVSTASNIPDFRSSDGLYSKKLNRNFTPEQAVSHTFLMKYPEEFYEFYKKNLVYPDAKPNACHIALAKLEEMGKLKAVVTQNIDGLHQKAGSKRVYELHGTTLRNYCNQCGKEYEADYIFESKEYIPRCQCGGIVRPYVTLYEEGLPEDAVNGAINAISNADMLIIGGTSLKVYPAASYIQYFKGKHLVVINREKLDVKLDMKDDLCICGSLGDVFNELSNYAPSIQ